MLLEHYYVFKKRLLQNNAESKLAVGEFDFKSINFFNARFALVDCHAP